MRIVLATVAAIALSTSAGAVTLVNGSFENGVAPNGSTVLATGDTTSLAGWKVLADGVDYVDSTIWAASNGSRSLDLSAASTGGIVQRIEDWVIGQRYRLRFDISANPFDPAARPREKRFLVGATAVSPQVFSYSLTDANTSADMLYQTYSFEFTAQNARTAIRFQSLVDGDYGVVLDNVRLTAVPETATWALLLAGFGLIGLVARRPSRTSLAA